MEKFPQQPENNEEDLRESHDVAESTPGEEILNEELKLDKEAVKIESEIEKMPPQEREKIGLGLRNIGFFVQERKSRLMAGICEKFTKEKDGQGTVSRFFNSLAGTYRKDEEIARKKIEEREKSAGVMKRMQNSGYLTGNILKFGRTVADVAGWTAGSPLRYVMLGAQFFSRGAEAAKEARLKNYEVIEKTRVKDIDEAADEAWKIYEKAGAKTKEGLDKAYAENLPEDILNRLKRSEPGTGSALLSKVFQKVLQKDVEFAIKHGKFNESSFERRLKEFDRIVGHYGTVDALAMGAKYAETGGKAVIAGVQIESVALLFKKLPEILASFSHVPEVSSLKTGVASKITEIPFKAPEAPAIESMVEVQKGNTVWKLAEEQLDKRGFFKDLTGSADEIVAKKNFLIDSVSHKVDVSSGDANLIHAGEKINFKDIFENKDTMAQLVDKSEHLKPMGASHILESVQKPKIATGASKNVLELFDQQDRPEKWRTIQIYQDDIDSMKQNLTKFKEPEIIESIQKEINRLEEVKHSLINKLAEQTEQTVPQVPVGAEKTAEAVANILPGEKQNFLDYLVYKDDRLVGFKVKALVEQIKSDKLTAEDFSKYYASKIGAERVSDKILGSFKYNFKAISGTNAVERLKAEGVIAAFLKRLESIK